MNKNVGIVGADPTEILADLIGNNFLEEWPELTTDSNAVCLLKDAVYPEELYCFVTHNDIAVLFIASGVMFVHTDKDFDAKQFRRYLESIGTVFWESDN
jgi:hypothetical protein